MTSSFIGSAFGLFSLLVCLFLYFLPAYLARNRQHHNASAIAAVNLLLGWTFLGWVLALAWSLTAVDPSKRPARKTPPVPSPVPEREGFALPEGFALAGAEPQAPRRKRMDRYTAVCLWVLIPGLLTLAGMIALVAGQDQSPTTAGVPNAKPVLTPESVTFAPSPSPLPLARPFATASAHRPRHPRHDGH